MRVRTRRRFGDELVDEPDAVRGLDPGTQRCRGTSALPGVAIEDRGARLGRSDGVDRVLQGEHAVAERQRQRTA